MTVSSTTESLTTESSTTDYQYVGCYGDAGDRDLPILIISNHQQLTIQLCVSTCAEYKYAGVQYR